jgi:DNA-binding transcriptional MerR regulator
VADALAVVDYEEPANRQVRAIPDQRSIRYYTTLGLLDRPVEMRGRTALYGPRHLRQLVAIKRLQGLGHSLAEVQEALAGASERKLAAIARVPDTVLDAAVDAAADAVVDPDPAHGEPAPDHHELAGAAHDHAAHGARPSERAEGFWAVLPPERSEVEPILDTAAEEPPGALLAAIEPADHDSDAVVLARVPLGRGVSLLVEPARSLTRDDVTAIRRAAAAVIEELAGRGICPSSGGQARPERSQRQAPTQAPTQASTQEQRQAQPQSRPARSATRRRPWNKQSIS